MKVGRGHVFANTSHHDHVVQTRHGHVRGAAARTHYVLFAELWRVGGRKMNDDLLTIHDEMILNMMIILSYLTRTAAQLGSAHALDPQDLVFGN